VSDDRKNGKVYFLLEVAIVGGRLPLRPPSKMGDAAPRPPYNRRPCIRHKNTNTLWSARVNQRHPKEEPTGITHCRKLLRDMRPFFGSSNSDKSLAVMAYAQWIQYVCHAVKLITKQQCLCFLKPKTPLTSTCRGFGVQHAVEQLGHKESTTPW